MKLRFFPLVFFTLLFFAPPVSAGQGAELFVKRGCVRCHTIGRGRFAGPDLKGVFDRYSRRQVVQWIKNPAAIYESAGKMPVNEGYPPMPKSQLAPGEAEKIADYLFSAADEPPSPAGGGTIFGTVINKTTGEFAAGIEVFLGSFLGDRRVSEAIAETGRKGGFRFAGLSWTAAHKISIRSGDFLYETDKMVFAPGREEIELDLPVYETSADDGNLKVEFVQMALEPLDDGVRVAEFVEFVNAGNTAVAASAPSAPLLGVPAPARSLNFVHGALNPSGAFTVLPGSKRVVFSYLIPFERGLFGARQTEFAKNFPYGAAAFFVLSPVSAGVAVEGLGEGRRVSGRDGRRFMRWSGEGIKKGGAVRISVVPPTGGGRPAWILPAAVFFLVVAAAGLFRLAFGRRA